MVRPRHLGKFWNLVLGWSHPILFSQLSILCTRTFCIDKNTVVWYSYFSSASPDLDPPASASPNQFLFQVLLSLHICATSLATHFVISVFSTISGVFCAPFLASSSSFYLSNSMISKSGVFKESLVNRLSPLLSCSISSTSHKSYGQVKPFLEAEIFQFHY